MEINDILTRRLEVFAEANLDDEDALLTFLRLTRLASERGMPLDPEEMRREIFGYLPGEPFTIRFDPSKSLRYIVDDLMAQAVKRQSENPGTMFAGAILQHLVGAKLALILGDEHVTRHGSSVADDSSSRSGDFMIEDVSIHVTTAPGEALMSKCLDNLNCGLRPLVITTSQSLAGAQSLAEIKGIGQRVDIIDASQFLATNFYEWSRFKSDARKISVEKLVAKYNEIVTECETDPGLRIGLGK